MKLKIAKIGAVVALLLFMLANTGATRPTPGKRIEISAKRFTYQPDQITLKKGETVTLVFQSLDVSHGFALDDFHVKVDIPKHQTSQVTFTPDKVGDFTAKCSHFCGVGHGNMRMTVHVTE